MENYNGFKMETITVSDRETYIVYPKEGTENGKWILKTEYFDAFPDTQIRLLGEGYHLVHIKNETRWVGAEDTKKRADLAKYMHETLCLSKKCAIIGMSCGGMQGIYFGAEYPEYVACMYLDAPVVNLLSCPAGLGLGRNIHFEEFKTHRKMDLTALISYRNHPLDKLPELVKNDIPVILVSGDSDNVVPYNENGAFLKEAYENAGRTIKTIIKPGCDHHPHGLDDNSIIVDFIKKYY